MPSVLRMILAVILGLILGSAVNMGLIMVSGTMISPPAGANVTTMEGLKASLHLFEPRHFFFPFLAHALGTAIGALLASLVVKARSALPAYVVGGVFLAGGVANAFMLPAPAWFIAADLILAYLPNAALGLWLARRIRFKDGV